jgi:adenylate cyclase
VSAEGDKSKASKGFIYSHGGFFVRGGDPMATGDVKRKLSAIFSADVEGYSRLMEEDELATMETLTSHKEIMRKMIRQYRGRVVDSTGDNLLAEFASVVDAVQCAVEVQQVLSAKNETLPENRRMYFRIGINLGDVVEEGERIYGDGVNVAARVESLAEGGGISISGTAYDQLGKKLPLGYEYLGEQSVKNIEKPVRVYRILTEAEAAGKVIGEVRPKTKQLRWAAIGGVVVLILVAGALAIWNFYLRPPFEPASEERMAFALPDKPSIAVLPFVNISEDPKQEYFSDGLTEEIITALSKIRELFVIASHSTFSYKGKQVKVQQVAEELGVRYVLEGSVRKSEERVRITAQLIDALKGHHLWAERYDRSVNDIFVLQDDITKEIIIALQLKMMPGDEVPIYAKGTDNLDAYLKAMEGYWHYTQWTKEGALRAQQLAQEAIALDPSYAYAYHVLGRCHSLILWLGFAKSPQESLRSSIELENKAISLDDSLAIAHAGLGYSLFLARQYDKAIAAGKRAVSLEPHSANVLYSHASVLMFAGRNEEAITLFEEALRLNPRPNNNLYRHFGSALANIGRYEEAIALQKKAIEQNPNDIFAYMVLASVSSMAGNEAEARAAANEVLRINPNFSVAEVRKVRPDKDRAVAKRWCDTLREAGLPETPPLPLPDKPSIAVLPFVNMSGDPEQEYFSDGISEEIITALSKTPKLFVIARSSSFKYKGKEVDVRTVGRELGVRHVLEGSVRRAGDKVRITAQLIDAKTNQHLWAERYDRDLKDIFTLQDEITKKIITALQVKLTAGEQARLSSRGTDNLDAYLKCLAAREHLLRFNKDDNLIARQKAEEAIALDPKYSDAYSLLGKTHILDAWFNWSESPKESMGNAFKLAKKALALDEDNSLAHRILSNMYLLERQHDKAIAEGQRAVSLAPNAPDELFQLGVILRFSGKAKEAVSMFERAIRLNPMPPASYLYHLGLSYAFIGEFEKAIAVCKKALPENPNDFVGRITLTIAYSSLGREEEARSEATEVLRIDPNFTLEYALNTWPYKNQADRDLVFGALRKAGLK